jgi:hypothetical protein
MGISRTACTATQPLSQATLLAYLASDVDPNNVIEASTGNIIALTGQSQLVVQENFRTGVWLPIERLSPRKLLVNSKDKWSINSFDPISGLVCITFISPSGSRNMTFTLPRYNYF